MAQTEHTAYTIADRLLDVLEDSPPPPAVLFVCNKWSEIILQRNATVLAHNKLMEEKERERLEKEKEKADQEKAAVKEKSKGSDEGKIPRDIKSPREGTFIFAPSVEMNFRRILFDLKSFHYYFVIDD